MASFMDEYRKRGLQGVGAKIGQAVRPIGQFLGEVGQTAGQLPAAIMQGEQYSASLPPQRVVGQSSVPPNYEPGPNNPAEQMAPDVAEFMGRSVAAPIAPGSYYLGPQALQAGEIQFPGGAPTGAAGLARGLDQAQQRAQFLGNAQWTGGGAIGNAVGQARQAATDAIQQQGREAAAMYGIRRLGSTEAEQDVTAQNAALRSGGSIQARQRAYDKVTGDINMRNARRDAMALAENELAGKVEIGKYNADALANREANRNSSRRDVALIGLTGRLAEIGAKRDIAKESNAIRMAVEKAGNEQEARSMTVKTLGDMGIQVTDPQTGKTTPTAQAYLDFAMGQFGQTDQAVQKANPMIDNNNIANMVTPEARTAAKISDVDEQAYDWLRTQAEPNSAQALSVLGSLERRLGPDGKLFKSKVEQAWKDRQKTQPQL